MAPQLVSTETFSPFLTLTDEREAESYFAELSYFEHMKARLWADLDRADKIHEGPEEVSISLRFVSSSFFAFSFFDQTFLLAHVFFFSPLCFYRFYS